MADDIRLAHFDASNVATVYDEMVRLYAETHEDLSANPFYSTERFAADFVKQRAHEGFELVAAYLGARLVGVLFGFGRLGGRQYALCELMVSPVHRRQGIAKRLHDELLAYRPEPQADLYVRKDNAPAQAAYRKWGWTKVGDVQPTPAAPNFDELVLQLPICRTDSRPRPQ